MDKPKIEILDFEGYSRDPTCLTLILREEDHTIGNSLKHILCRMRGVEFCGYNVPHPLEDKILLRLQTKDGVVAGTVLLEALAHLETIFASIRDKFQTSYDEFVRIREA
ncbi:putative DNA-directed RNA polymerases I and III subunit RPAC2 [Parelaphostrongylus tenuis]|uniref:DNA-directed RNA polymerase I subunit D n=1 Tax=Parelaphostrongylus tenuis TaxID=148309 RepID=A0AAD5QU62_PARTN|nr:putative DNA-directed RNA polymerases I and III subunit RPAC2 [Parelaphostrongylus tenuis]